MRILLKALGLIFIMMVCTAFGFLKALALKSRVDSLQQIKNGLLKLKEQLRLHKGNKQQLLKNCFPVFQNLLGLSRSDKTLWDDFITDFGKGDTKQEFERCNAFIALYDNALLQAKTECEKQQKLYKALGILSGLFICIFFL